MHKLEAEVKEADEWGKFTFGRENRSPDILVVIKNISSDI